MVGPEDQNEIQNLSETHSKDLVSDLTSLSSKDKTSCDHITDTIGELKKLVADLEGSHTPASSALSKPSEHHHAHHSDKVDHAKLKADRILEKAKEKAEASKVAG